MTMEGNATLSELYREHREQTFNAALETLFEKTLPAWQQEKTVADGSRSLADLYSAALGGGPQPVLAAEVRRRIRTVAQQSPRLGAWI